MNTTTRYLFILVLIPFLVQAAQRCPATVRSNDGSTYSLKNIEGLVISGGYTDFGTRQDVFVNMTICNNLDAPCGSNACSQPNSAAVCAYKSHLKKRSAPEECYGSFDQRTTVVGLNGNAGVMITYYDGDKYAAGQNYSTQLTLNCDVTLKKGEVFVDKVDGSNESVMEVQARMWCAKSALPWIETDTYYKDPGCNSFNVYLETNSNVATCTPGCYPGSLPGTSIQVSCTRAN